MQAGAYYVYDINVWLSMLFLFVGSRRTIGRGSGRVTLSTLFRPARRWRLVADHRLGAIAGSAIAGSASAGSASAGAAGAAAAAAPRGGGGTLFAMSAKSFIEPYCRESPRVLAGSRKESMSSSVSVVVESAERGGGVGTNEAAEPPPPSVASAALHRGGGGGIPPGRRGDGSGAPPGNAGAVIGRAPHMLP